MLGSLTVTVTAHLSDRILIDVRGVGYWVYTGSWHPTSEVVAFLYHAVREDASDLYGFESLEQLGFFEQLLGISGIGPKAALAVLSLGSPDRLRQAIASKDVAFITKASGIGPKAAQKIILELFGKLDSLDGLLDESHVTLSIPSNQRELADALIGLGYKPSDINELLQQLPTEITTISEQLRWALQRNR